MDKEQSQKTVLKTAGVTVRADVLQFRGSTYATEAIREATVKKAHSQALQLGSFLVFCAFLSFSGVILILLIRAPDMRRFLGAFATFLFFSGAILVVIGLTTKRWAISLSTTFGAAQIPLRNEPDAHRLAAAINSVALAKPDIAAGTEPPRDEPEGA